MTLASALPGARVRAVTLQAPIQRRPGEAQRLGRLADVAVEARHRLLDQEALDVLEAHVLEAAAAVLRACAGRGRSA